MNNKGIALILSYTLIAVLTVLGSAFVARSISESNIARRYTDSARAFWIAEAGLAQGYYNWVNNQPLEDNDFGGGSYAIDDSNLPEVVVTGTLAGTQRALKAYFVRIPLPFDNTLSIGGDLSLSGLLAKVEVYDKTRISGVYSKSGLATGWFEDKQEGVSQDGTTIKIPDYNNNGSGDEFEDFVLFGQEVILSYPAEEVVYIQDNGTVNIFPDQALVGKKVIFVEGSTSGQGDVNIIFDGTWQEGEDLTVISTGTITYIEPLQYQEEARLSTISWDDYNEASIFRSQHESVIYTHDDANFVDILDWGSTTGNIIANDDISLKEVLTYEKYYHSDRAINGDLPPGFKLLSGATGTPNLLDWQEIP